MDFEDWLSSKFLSHTLVHKAFVDDIERLQSVDQHVRNKKQYSYGYNPHHQPKEDSLTRCFFVL